MIIMLSNRQLTGVADWQVGDIFQGAVKWAAEGWGYSWGFCAFEYSHFTANRVLLWRFRSDSLLESQSRGDRGIISIIP